MTEALRLFLSEHDPTGTRLSFDLTELELAELVDACILEVETEYEARIEELEGELEDSYCVEDHCYDACENA